MEKIYQVRRLNAVKHGILSKEAVLPHESKEEFEDLLAQYEADFVPVNVTESTLVEELATIVWRKKRLLKAENAKINNGLANALNLSQRLLNSTAPLSLHIEDEKIEIREFLRLSAEELEEKRKEMESEEQKRQRAEEILSQGGRNCTKRASEASGISCLIFGTQMSMLSTTGTGYRSSYRGRLKVPLNKHWRLFITSQKSKNRRLGTPSIRSILILLPDMKLT